MDEQDAERESGNTAENKDRAKWFSPALLKRDIRQKTFICSSINTTIADNTNNNQAQRLAVLAMMIPPPLPSVIYDYLSAAGHCYMLMGKKHNSYRYTRHQSDSHVKSLDELSLVHVSNSLTVLVDDC